MNDELRAEARAAWSVARKQLQIALRYRFGSVNQVLQPLYQVLLPGILLGATFAIGGEAVGLEATTGTTDLAGYLFLGMLALTLSTAGFWDVAFSMKQEMDAGTLEPSWLTPTRRETFILGQTLAGLLLASVTLVCLVAIGILLFGARMAPALAIAIPVVALTAVGVLGIGYLVGAIVLRMREPSFFVDASDFLFAGLSGAAFPIIVLPEAVRWIAYLLPTTYAVDIVRVSALGTHALLPAPVEWVALIVTSVALVLLGRWVWLATERRMRIRGTLGQH